MLKELKKDKIKKRTVFIAMSGGVDSSVAALLLKNQGYDVVGVFMRCWSGNIAAPFKRGEPRLLFYNERDGCAERDAEDARRVAEKLKIPFYVWDFEKEYKKQVVEYMIDGYKKGITPNPDVMCNKEIKFGIFLEKALEMGVDYVATGHYVKIKNQKSKIKIANQNSKIIYKLFQAKDLNKDQSYFLWTLTQEQLKHCLFPIGDYLKSEVREVARKAGLPTAEKKDSQGICFLGKVTLDDFLKQYIPEKRGKVLSAKGKILGEHKGAQFYTIGQRHLKIDQRPTTNNQQPFYVVEKDVRKNTLVIAEGSENPELYKKEIKLANVNFISPITNYQLPITNSARVRYRQPLASAKLYKLKANSYKLIFDEPQKFIAPGQSAVFYTEECEMLGGGIII